MGFIRQYICSMDNTARSVGCSASSVRVCGQRRVVRIVCGSVCGVGDESRYVNKSFDIHISRKCREVVSSNYMYKSKIMWLCIAFKKMRLSAVGQRFVWRQNPIVPALMGSIRFSFKSSLHLVFD